MRKEKRIHLAIEGMFALLVLWALSGAALYKLDSKWYSFFKHPLGKFAGLFLWGLLASSLHKFLCKKTFDSIPQQARSFRLLSLTGIFTCVQIVAVYFAAWNEANKKLVIDDSMKQEEHPYDPFEEVQLEYIRQKYGAGLRNEELCAQLERVGRDCYRCYQEHPLDEHPAEVSPITYIREGLALYRALAPLTREERPAYKEEILKKASQKLKYYHPDVQEQVYDLLDTYLSGGMVYGTVLAGPPGTGKTELAKTLASLFPDGECVEIKLGGRSPAELGGDTKDKKGYLLEAFLPVALAGKKVRVICFDEMEKALDKRAVNNRELLTTLLSLENGEYCLYSAYFNTHFAFTGMRIYPVNSKEELQLTEALLNRFVVIDVPGYSAEAKYWLYTEPGGLLDKMLASMHLDLARKDDPAVQEMLKELIAKDQDPGLRSLGSKVSRALIRMNRRWRKEATSSSAT